MLVLIEAPTVLLYSIAVLFVCTFEVVESDTVTAQSQKLEHATRIIYAGIPSFFGLGLEDGHVPTLWLLLYKVVKKFFMRKPDGVQWFRRMPQLG